jgi:hypothetical protein
MPAPVDGRLLLGAESRPGYLEELATEVGSQLNGAVGTPRINDNNLPGERNASQTIGKIVGLVFRDDRDGKGDLICH